MLKKKSLRAGAMARLTLLAALTLSYSAGFAQHNNAQSFTQLLEQEGARAGEPDYDLALGQAALHEDEPSIAALSFERCLSVESQNELCRLGMAHAHILLGERQSAHNELDHLQRSSRSAEVQRTISQYLAMLSRAESHSEVAQLSSYLQVGIGYDSNINSAASISEIALPALDDEIYILPAEHQRKKSGAMTARYHIRYSKPLQNQWRLIAQGNIAAKGNFKTSRYDTLVSDVTVGLERSINQHQLSAKVKLQNYRLRNRSFRNMGSFIGQYAYSIDNSTEVSGFVQASKLNYSSSRYIADNGRRNARRYVGGASLLRRFADERAIAYVTAYGGTHRKTKGRAPEHINHNLAGLRVGGAYLLTPRLQLEGGVAIERRHFRTEHSSFLKKRKDTFYDAYLGAVYAINRKLTLRPQYQFYRNHSNIPLSRYKRHVLMLNLRYDLL